MNFATPILRQVHALFVLFMLLFSLSMASMPALAFDGGLNETANVAKDKGGPSFDPASNQNKKDISERVGEIIGLALSYVGVIFFVLIVYGGLQWMTAQGNDQKVAKSKELIINATIGLIIVLSAYAITSFIGNSLTTTE
jgi:hypothetical protein